ncbi:tyrosine-type recombinase/integrase [Mucilaginibacter sp. X4EP1]|uniref:tyrosine-type recombinase/integrase n=1 Tax=Mucilaginibacter sp. X4EP1 TaxID=2723092 RepID=UPI0021687C36|nr:tyrosine-type recombinase/integrase [Mucilaginibacter sp. X4EP1]MCS3816664.1 site-specific recombinase XerD [Mucilaginibacter sp. X4EP1]
MQGTPKNPLYIRLQTGFTQWLRILNFEPTSQRDMPKMLDEFLAYLELQNCLHPHDIQSDHLKNYFEYLDQRPNQKWGGGLSKNYIRKQLQVIRKFSRYLTESGQESFTVKMRIKGKSSNIKCILTQAEISRLYAAVKDDTLGLRDKAILALYYGCGLRKNEGASINVRDILLDKELVYVRKGKGYKERYVPLAGIGIADLQNYILYARPLLAGDKKDEALLLSVTGTRLSGHTAYERLQKLKKTAGIKKPAGLHTLRHSIASHLLHSGMKLEQIQRFLGHSSMESTQIYTHLKHEQV